MSFLLRILPAAMFAAGASGFAGAETLKAAPDQPLQAVLDRARAGDVIELAPIEGGFYGAFRSLEGVRWSVGVESRHDRTHLGREDVCSRGGPLSQLDVSEMFRGSKIHTYLDKGCSGPFHGAHKKAIPPYRPTPLIVSVGISRANPDYRYCHNDRHEYYD